MTRFGAVAACGLLAALPAGQAGALSFAACSFSTEGSISQDGPVSCGTLPDGGTPPVDTAGADVGVAAGEIKAYLHTDDTQAEVIPGRAVITGITEELVFDNAGTTSAQADVTFTVDGSVSGNILDPDGIFPTGFVAAFLAISTGQPLTDASGVTLLPFSTTVYEGAVLDVGQTQLASGTVGLFEASGLHTVTGDPFLPDGQGGTRNTPDDIAFELALSQSFDPGETTYWVTTGFYISAASADGTPVILDFSQTGTLGISSESDDLSFSNSNGLLSAPGTAAVPLPASAWLLAGALGLLGAARRARRG